MSFGNLELHGHSYIFFLGVHRNDPGTNSTDNHKFYKTLGRLHDPWRRKPLSTPLKFPNHKFPITPKKMMLLVKGVVNL